MLLLAGYLLFDKPLTASWKSARNTTRNVGSQEKEKAYFNHSLRYTIVCPFDDALERDTSADAISFNLFFMLNCGASFGSARLDFPLRSQSHEVDKPILKDSESDIRELLNKHFLARSLSVSSDMNRACISTGKVSMRSHITIITPESTPESTANNDATMQNNDQHYIACESEEIRISSPRSSINKSTMAARLMSRSDVAISKIKAITTEHEEKEGLI